MTDETIVDPTLELQAAAIEALRTDARSVQAFGGADKVAVWDIAPGRAAGAEETVGYPFVEVSEAESVADGPPLGPDELDDAFDDPTEAFLTVHVYALDKVEARTIAAAARKVLADELELPSFRVTLGEMRNARHFTESDGRTAHSVLTFRYRIEPKGP